MLPSKPSIRGPKWERRTFCRPFPCECHLGALLLLEGEREVVNHIMIDSPTRRCKVRRNAVDHGDSPLLTFYLDHLITRQTKARH